MNYKKPTYEEQKQRIQELEQAETQHNQVQEALLLRTHELEERIKELNCLYGISKIWRKPGYSFDVMIQEIIDILPESWQYPEITCAKAIIDGIAYRTKNFRETKWKLACSIIVYREKVGAIEIYYLEEKPKSDEGPFLNEERNLINAISDQLARIIENERIEETLRENENKHRHKIESIGTLTGSVAHDVSNLLYTITGNAELALDDIPEWSPAYTNLKEIISAGLRTADIVKQLINLNRKTDHELKPTEIVTVIKNAFELLRSLIPPTIEIRRHLPKTDITILADPAQINQVIISLCINASQVMDGMGNILRINVENVILNETTIDSYPGLTMGEHIKIMVSDTGPGIDPEIIGRIFDPYFTTKEVGKGSIMGLTVTRDIVKNHGGAITVDSEHGKGTTFTMLFPVIKEKSKDETESADALSIGTERILFVDDKKSIVNMAGQMLERLGYRVETKQNPAEALELFKSNPDEFDLVITDMTMPQMTGVKLYEKLKEVRPDISVIISTGHSSLIDEEKAKEMGIDGYVMKPIVKRDIAMAIRKVLDI
jgi:signal transduction histidine kinase